MKHWCRLGLVLLSSLAACAVPVGEEELSSLAEKPALPYSILITGGAFVQASTDRDLSGPLSRTYEFADTRAEAFELKRLESILEFAKVFVETRLDARTASERRVWAGLGQRVALQEPALRQSLLAARRAGHDFLLVVERVQDGPVESRGINDRWPFTVGAWLFALGALIPDRTYESRAGLNISMRDVYSGQRVLGPILVEPGPVDLNMIERCGLWGFVQSIVIPPFWTSTDDPSIVESVRSNSTDRILVSVARRLKSAEVTGRLAQSGPASIRVASAGDALQITVVAKEPLNSVALRLDGEALEPVFVRRVQRSLLSSEARTEDDPGEFVYDASFTLPRPGRMLQVMVATEAARFSSVTQDLRVR